MKKAIFILTIMISSLTAEIKLPAIISDNMIISGDNSAKVWGTTTANKAVKITFTTDQTSVKTSVKADQNGSFEGKLKLGLLNGKIGTLEFKTEQDHMTIKNVLVGDVWLASGQSNMAFTMAKTNTAKEDIAQANYPEIRWFYVPRDARPLPQHDYSKLKPLTPSWKICTPATAKKFSAVAYHFAQSIHKTQKRPVGIIECSWGGSMVEAWLSQDSMTTERAVRKFYTEWNQSFEEFIKDSQNAKKIGANVVTGKELPINQKGLPWKFTRQHRPSWLYNAMYLPIANFTIKGVIWYQGESNARDFQQMSRYAPAFEALVKQYRVDNNNPQLPVFWVNLAGFEPSAKHKTTWANFRNIQTSLLEIPYTAQALAFDVGSKRDVHPKNKKTVGQRLALCARKMVYQEDVNHQGPTFEKVVYNNSSTLVTFKTASSLKIEGKPWFEVAGKDGKFHAATVTVKSANSVELASPKVSLPKAVRYGWRGITTGHIYDQDGLPAVPFTTEEVNYSDAHK